MLVWVQWGKEEVERAVSIKGFKPKCLQDQAGKVINEEVWVGCWLMCQSKADSSCSVPVYCYRGGMPGFKELEIWIYVKSPNV